MSSTITPSTASSSGTGSASTAASLITSTGIGSGLNISAIVTALTNNYGAAQTAQLDAQSQTLNAQVSAYGTFTSALDALKSSLSDLEVPSHLAAFSGSVADKDIASATTDSSAVAGQYSLQVNTLATSASLTSGPFASSATQVGTGTLAISVGGKSVNVTIDSTDNTLAQIASAINAAPGNPGVTASIITTSAGSRLVIAGTATGAANAVTVTQSGGDGGLAGLVYDPANGITKLTQSQAAADATFTINGFPATSASNVVTGAITGVTINLLAASAADTPTTLSVAPDTSAATASITKFVTALNGVVSAIQSLTSYDPTSGVAGPLNGNATLESFQNQLQSLLGQINRNGTTGINSLADIGLTANPDGTYALDTTKLGNALAGNLPGVTGLLSGVNGLATQLDTLVGGYTNTGGLLDSINQGLLSSLKSVTQQQNDLQTQLAAYSATLTAQYNAMDAAVAQLKVTQQYLTAQFNAGSTTSSSSSSNSSFSSGNLSTGG
jgi:flagellar hook-associated protein 2